MSLVEIEKRPPVTLDEALLKRFYRLREDFLWILTTKKKLRKKYPNKYVAVRNRTVRFANDTIEELLAEIKTHREQVDDFAIEYIGEHPVNLLL